MRTDQREHPLLSLGHRLQLYPLVEAEVALVTMVLLAQHQLVVVMVEVVLFMYLFQKLLLIL